jgi:hypothetical protein
MNCHYHRHYSSADLQDYFNYINYTSLTQQNMKTDPLSNKQRKQTLFISPLSRVSFILCDEGRKKFVRCARLSLRSFGRRLIKATFSENLAKYQK